MGYPLWTWEGVPPSRPRIGYYLLPPPDLGWGNSPPPHPDLRLKILHSLILVVINNNYWLVSVSLVVEVRGVLTFCSKMLRTHLTVL